MWLGVACAVAVGSHLSHPSTLFASVSPSSLVALIGPMRTLLVDAPFMQAAKP
jgi:hypothetical protein